MHTFPKTALQSLSNFRTFAPFFSPFPQSVLHLVRNNTPYAVLSLLILAVLTGVGGVVVPVGLPPVSQPLYYLFVRGVKSVLGESALGWQVLYLLLLFLQALYVNALAMRHRLLPKPTFTPAFVFIIFAALFPTFRTISPPLIGNFFLLGALDAMLQFGKPTQPRRQIFNAGFLIGAAAFVQFSFLFSGIILLVALLLLRPFHPGEYFSALLGLITPLYFVTGVMFLTDTLPMLRAWPFVHIQLPPWQPAHRIVVIILYALAGLLLLAGLLQLNQQMNRSVIYVRRSWGVLVSGLVVSVAMAVFTSLPQVQSWLMIAPFFALMVSAALETEKPRWFAIFAFWTALALPFIGKFFL